MLQPVWPAIRESVSPAVWRDGGWLGTDLLRPGALVAPLSLARAQAAGARSTALQADGATWAEYAADVPRFSGPDQRLLIGGQRTNGIRNPRQDGATSGVIGSGGVLPTNYSIAGSAGLQYEITGPVTRGGIVGYDWRFFGTATSTGSVRPIFEPTGVIVAMQGQAWTGSVVLALVAGSTAGINASGINVRLEEMNNSGGVITATPLLSTAGILDATPRRFSVGRTFTDAAAAFVRLGLQFSAEAAGSAIEASLFIGWPTVELGAFASNPILPAIGTPAASTRGADLVTAPLSSLGIGANGACTLLASFLVPQTPPAGVGQMLMQIDVGTGANRIFLENGGGTDINIRRTTAGAFLSVLAGTFTPGTLVRVGLSIDGTGRAVASINGAAAVPITGAPTSGLTTLRLGSDAGGGAALSGEVQAVRYLPYAISDAALAAAVAAL